VAGLALRVA
jgi:hypothetical protein